jgi:hypothetical protein
MQPDAGAEAPTEVAPAAEPEPVPPEIEPPPVPAPDPRPAESAASFAKPSAPEPSSWSAAAEPESAASEPESTDSSGGAAATVNDRPEIAIGGAFAGGFVIAMILKRLAR